MIRGEYMRTTKLRSTEGKGHVGAKFKLCPIGLKLDRWNPLYEGSMKKITPRSKVIWGQTVSLSCQCSHSIWALIAAGALVLIK